MKTIISKKVLIFIVLIVVLIIGSSCGEEKIEESFTGEWLASQNTLEGSIYTGDITFVSTEEGKFKISNSFNTISMEGNYVLKEDGKIELECEGEFLPPYFWESSYLDEYNYEFVSEDVFIISYYDNEIAFFRQAESLLLEELKNDNWLTGNGLEEDKVIYRVEMTDDEINFYLLDGDTILRIINGRNLEYDEEKSELRFIPDTSVYFEPPYMWYSDMEKDMKEISISVELDDSKMVLTYKDIPITFYNDFMYMTDTEAEIYKLFGNSWVLNEGSKYYTLDFLMGDTVFVSCYDETENEYFNGAVLIDENLHKMNFYIEIFKDIPEFLGGLENEIIVDYEFENDTIVLTSGDETLVLEPR